MNPKLDAPGIDRRPVARELADPGLTRRVKPIERYKVTSGDPPTSLYFCNPLRVRYSTEFWVEARVGGLLVFRHLDQGLKFAAGITPGGLGKNLPLIPVPVTLWRCEVEEQVDLCSPLLIPMTSERGMRWAWKCETFPKELIPLSGWPHGTEAWKRVKLVEKLEMFSRPTPRGEAASIIREDER